MYPTYILIVCFYGGSLAGSPSYVGWTSVRAEECAVAVGMCVLSMPRRTFRGSNISLTIRVIYIY